MKIGEILLKPRTLRPERQLPAPELVLLTVPNKIREYFYTKLRFSTPAKCALLPLTGQIC